MPTEANSMADLFTGEFDPADIAYVLENSPPGTTRAQVMAAIRSQGHRTGNTRYDLSDDGRANVIGNLGRAADSEEARESYTFMHELALSQANAQREAAVGAARDIGDYNYGRFPDIADRATDTSIETARTLSAFLREQFEGAWDRLYPSWREDMVGAAGAAQGDSIDITNRFREKVMPKILDAADQASNQALINVNAQLRGDVPPDVEARLRRSSAEISNAIGLRGQARNFLTSRDLGLTSLDLMQQGLNNAPAAFGLAPGAYGTVNQTLQAPVATGTAATNLIGSFLPPMADPSALAGNFVSNLLGQSSVTPTSVLDISAQIGGQQAQLVQNQYQYNTSRVDDNYWNRINYDAQQRAAREAGRGSPMNNMMSGAAMGFAAGGPWGAAAGAAGGYFLGGK